LAGIGLFYLFWNSRFRRRSLFVTGFLILSFLSVSPGLYFRHHYWILFLPAVAILAAVGITLVFDIFANCRTVFMVKVLPTVLVLAAFSLTIYRHRAYFFVTSPQTICRYTYWPNPFVESLEIAEFIRQNSQKDDTVAVLGSEPQIYFYSRRLSATGYVYTYPLMELQPYASKMQEEMIDQIEQTKPKFLVLERLTFAWLPHEKSDKKIFYWIEQYASKFYHTVGIVDLISREQTIYRWGPEAANYSPQSKSYLLILRHNRCGDASNILPLRTDVTDETK
jgi:4-amino-4-deoxy-L-arabinose transferase-like glycosyltransferase